MTIRHENAGRGEAARFGVPSAAARLLQPGELAQRAGYGHALRVWPGWRMTVYFSDWRSAITRLTLARNAGPLRVPLL